MNIIITGSSGLIGSHVASYLRTKRDKSFNIFTPTHDEMNIINKKDVSAYFKKHKSADVILHFAAYTDVSMAEQQRNDESGSAWKTNVIGTRNIIREAKKHKCYLIHISTEAVFSGSKYNPGSYSEKDEIEKNSSNITWYGWTKCVNEHDIRNNLDKYAIIRLTNPIKIRFHSKLDYLGKIIKLFSKQKTPSLFQDQYTTIAPLDDLAQCIVKLMMHQFKGIFHIASSNLCTPYDAAEYLLFKFSKDASSIKKSSVANFINDPRYHHRYLQFGGLNAVWTYKLLGLRHKTWQEIIDYSLKKYNYNKFVIK